MLNAPELLPKAMSVYSLSPNMQASLAGMPVRADIKDIPAGSGLPKKRGSTPVAAVSMAAMAPLSGTKPLSVGHQVSLWVQRYSAPRRISRQAFSAF